MGESLGDFTPFLGIANLFEDWFCRKRKRK